MRKLLVCLLLLCAASVSAQDVIVKKDGSTILSKVLEVGQDEVKYKNFSNLDGPTYTIRKSELQSINYQNGAKDTFSPYKREENRFLPNNQNDGTQQYNDNALLKIDYAESNPYKKVKALRSTAWIGGGVFVAASIPFLVMYSNPDRGWYNDWTGYASLGCIGAGFAWFTAFHSAANKQEKIISSRLNSSVLYHYDFKLNDGSSFSAGIDMLSDRTPNQNTLGLGLRYNF